MSSGEGRGGVRQRRIRSRHFHLPARELLLEEPVACHYLPGLVLVGVAVTAEEQHHLIFELGGLEQVDRFYVRPTQDDVERRAQILATALQAGPQLDGFHAGLVQDWVLLAWEATLDAFVERLTGR